MIVITILPVAFAAGIFAGIAVLLRFGIARDDSCRSLREDPGTDSAAAARRILGLYVRMPRAPGGPGRADASPEFPGPALPDRDERAI